MQYQKLLQILNENEMSSWSCLLKEQIPSFFSTVNHGDFSSWINIVNYLPSIQISEINLD